MSKMTIAHRRFARAPCGPNRQVPRSGTHITPQPDASRQGAPWGLWWRASARPRRAGIWRGELRGEGLSRVAATRVGIRADELRGHLRWAPNLERWTTIAVARIGICSNELRAPAAGARASASSSHAPHRDLLKRTSRGVMRHQRLRRRGP